MAYPIVRIDPTTVGRGRSPALWRGALEKFATDPSLGILRADDFSTPKSGAVDTVKDGWCITEDGVAGATGESFYTNGDPNGVAVLGATTGADYRGVKMQAGALVAGGAPEGVVLPTATTGAKADCIFEARVYLDVNTNDTLFVGLAENVATVKLLGAASALPDDSDYIGFYRIDAGDFQFVVRNDNAGGTAVEYNITIQAAADITDGGWVQLGFRVNYDETVEIYIDGVRVRYTTSNVKVAVTVASLPEEALCRTISVGRGATADNATVACKCDSIEAYNAE